MMVMISHPLLVGNSSSSTTTKRRNHLELLANNPVPIVVPKNGAGYGSLASTSNSEVSAGRVSSGIRSYNMIPSLKK
jgi:hypothetical protein